MLLILSIQSGQNFKRLRRKASFLQASLTAGMTSSANRIVAIPLRFTSSNIGLKNSTSSVDRTYGRDAKPTRHLKCYFSI
jgi:hypothetical protein